jgi:glutathione S-transferase
MKLYYHPLSGHSHRVRLFISLIGVPAELVQVDLAAGQHKSSEFRNLNSFCQVPVLDDHGVLIPDSNAILIYLAKKFSLIDWLPESPAEAAAVRRWLSVAAGEIAFGPAAARLITVFGAKFNSEEVIARAHGILKHIDAALANRQWLAAAHPALADVAIYSYVARAPEGNVNLDTYRNVLAWLGRMEDLPGFVPFQQTPVGLTA